MSSSFRSTQPHRPKYQTLILSWGLSILQGIWGSSTQEVQVGSQELQASLCHQLVVTFPRATCLVPETVTSNRTNNPAPLVPGRRPDPGGQARLAHPDGTRCLQRALRLVAFRQIHKVLHMEQLPPRTRFGTGARARKRMREASQAQEGTRERKRGRQGTAGLP